MDGDKDLIERLRKQLNLYQHAMVTIRMTCGQVCPEYETCEHEVCRSSYTAWSIADDILNDRYTMTPRDLP